MASSGQEMMCNSYLQGKGKGNRAHTSGKGFGRRGNPKGRDGNPLACHGCGSTEHLIKNCPHKGKGKGNGGGSPPTIGGPFSGLAFNNTPSASSNQQLTGSHQAEGQLGDVPPWASDDLMFEAPNDIFATFGAGERNTTRPMG